MIKKIDFTITALYTAVCVEGRAMKDRRVKHDLSSYLLVCLIVHWL